MSGYKNEYPGSGPRVMCMKMTGQKMRMTGDEVQGMRMSKGGLSRN